MQGWCLILFSSTFLLPSIGLVTVVSYSNWSVLHGVGGSVLSICRDFLSNHRQRVVVDGATSEWITIVSVVRQGSVLGPLMFILYTSEMFELVENRLYVYADDSTLLETIRKPADRPAVAASISREVARIYEWYWILTNLWVYWLVDPGLWTIPMEIWSCLGIPFTLSRPQYSYREVWQKAHLRRPCVRYSHSWLSKKCFWGWKQPLCCFVATMHLFSQSLSIFSGVGGLLRIVIFSFSSARCIRWPGFALFGLSCRCAIDVMFLHSVCCTSLIRTR